MAMTTTMTAMMAAGHSEGDGGRVCSESDGGGVCSEGDGGGGTPQLQNGAEVWPLPCCFNYLFLYLIHTLGKYIYLL